MKRLLLLLRIPLAIELINVIAHRVIRPVSQDTHWMDDISMAITAAVMLFVGWTVARALNGVAVAMLGALPVWTCSVLAVIGLMSVKLLLQGTASREIELLVMKGFFFSALLSIPVVAVVSAIAGFIAIRTRRSPP